MYIIPLIFIVVIALAIFFSPILAVALLALALLALGAYKFFGPGTEPERASPETPGAAVGEPRDRSGEKAGPWGEQWPEERAEEEPR